MLLISSILYALPFTNAAKTVGTGMLWGGGFVAGSAIVGSVIHSARHKHQPEGVLMIVGQNKGPENGITSKEGPKPLTPSSPTSSHPSKSEPQSSDDKSKQS